MLQKYPKLSWHSKNSI